MCRCRVGCIVCVRIPQLAESSQTRSDVEDTSIEHVRFIGNVAATTIRLQKYFNGGGFGGGLAYPEAASDALRIAAPRTRVGGCYPARNVDFWDGRLLNYGLADPLPDLRPDLEATEFESNKPQSYGVL